MPKGTNQKLKLCYLMQIMLEKTDEEHSLTMQEILTELEKREVTAERKSIYSDLQELSKFGVEVESEQVGRVFYYRVIRRQFELAELKLLVDAIQSSKFITQRKSRELIGKLESLASRYEASQLQRQVYVQGRIKTMNESIYYSVDAIHAALSANQKISFRYYKWNYRLEKEYGHNGNLYIISPWGLSWDDENYYLIGYDSEAECIKHYRVDKMERLSIVNEKREGEDLFRHFDAAAYAKKSFGMFAGREEIVSIRLKKQMASIFIDRFGNDIRFMETDADHCVVRVKVAVSSQFFGWIFALGKDVQIVGPESVVSEMKAATRDLLQQYTEIPV